MKAILDHVGIAVEDSTPRWRSIATRSGSRSKRPRRCASQRVRAHFIPAGESGARAARGDRADSPIARYLEKRGPGLHHITLRVDDIRAALAHLNARGVRLVDEQPRPGAEGGAGRVHPSVGRARRAGRVEAGSAAPPASLAVKRLPFGRSAADERCTTGSFRLDGGAMFGVVPRPLWEKQAPPDDRNRIQLAMRPLLVEADWGRMLIDCGAGDKMDAKQRDIYALDRDRVTSTTRSRRPGSPRIASTSCWRRTCTSITSAARRSRRRRPAGAALPARPLPHPRGRVGGRDASARAQPRQLPAGRLRAAEGRRRRRLLRRRPRRSSPACAWSRTGGHTGSIRSSSSSRRAGRRSSPPT